MNTPPLSKRAAKLFERVKKGEFYPAYDKSTPKAMKELEEAGLVSTCGRVVVIRACYVPASGYTPFVPERFEQ